MVKKRLLFERLIGTISLAAELQPTFLWSVVCWHSRGSDRINRRRTETLQETGGKVFTGQVSLLVQKWIFTPAGKVKWFFFYLFLLTLKQMLGASQQSKSAKLCWMRPTLKILLHRFFFLFVSFYVLQTEQQEIRQHPHFQTMLNRPGND